MNPTLLSFSLGPVQDFIAAARTLRDLWTGSWLLSWLTANAAHEVMDASEQAELLFPSAWRGSERRGERVPLLAAVAAIKHGRKQDIPSDAMMACLPNTFVASVPHSQAEDLAEKCRRAVVSEWERIATGVHGQLAERWRERSGWDARWVDQVADFWDIRTAVLPGDVDQGTLRRLFFDRPDDPFQLRVQALGKLAAARKQVRHFPAHELAEYAREVTTPGREHRDDTRPKCSLLASHAQMGPIANGSQSQMAATAHFWTSVQKTDLDGTRLGKRDRLCAVSLVKRFAWPAVLAETLNQQRKARHFPDIDTICAAEWLESLDSDERYRDLEWNERHKRQPWSGHWLRWQSIEEAEEEGEIEPDAPTFDKIRRARSRESAGPPPTYYAVVQLDGDGIGKLLKKLDKDGLRDVSRRLTGFAGETVPQVIKDQGGLLVYAGGDDVLAFVPATKSLACASRLNQAFRALQLSNEPVTCTAAVVLAHYKTPLRIVLGETRAAEQAAKHAGPDRLALRVMKRSGEQATALVGWDQVSGDEERPTLQQFIRDFSNGATDRWTYRFRQQLDHLPIPAMWPAELKRLLGRAESLPKGFAERVLKFWSAYQEWSEQPASRDGADRPPTWPLSFVHLMQAASFLARGGKE